MRVEKLRLFKSENVSRVKAVSLAIQVAERGTPRTASAKLQERDLATKTIQESAVVTSVLVALQAVRKIVPPVLVFKHRIQIAERSVLTHRSSSRNRGPAQSEISRQSSRQLRQPSTLQNNGGNQSTSGNAIGRSTPSPGVRSVQPRIQHRVKKNPSSGNVQRYTHQNSSHGQRSFQHGNRSSSKVQRSSQSFRRSTGNSSGRGGKGHRGRGRSGR